MVTLPFMPEAAIHLRGVHEFDERTMMMGADRVRAALDGVNPAAARWADWSSGRAIEGIAPGGEYVEPDGARSYLAAAMICAKSSNHKLIGRFAYTEAVYAKHILEGVVMRRRRQAFSLLSAPPACDLNSVCSKVLGAEPGSDMGRYTMPVAQYLKLAVGLGRSWKLVNQVVYAGLVSVEPDDFVRLLRDAITAYIRKRIMDMRDLWAPSGGSKWDRARRPTPPSVDVPQDISEWCAKMVETPPSGDTPPCVGQCRAQLNRGINVPQSGRFLTATFYIQMGMDDAAIGEMFTGAPDYDPKITSYHIDQIRRREYSVPGCGWVKSHGLCPGCDAVHPAKYRKPEGKRDLKNGD